MADLISRIKENHPKLFWFLYRFRPQGLFGILWDTGTGLKVDGRQVIPFGERIKQTFRYRAAAAGLCLTGNEKKLRDLKDRHRGQRAFIMGNGPSLNKCDLSLLGDEITFGVNSIFLNYEKMGFHPTYYVVEDVFVAEDRADQISSYREPVKFFGSNLKYFLDPEGETIWLNVRNLSIDHPEFPRFSTNAIRMLWAGGTVSYLCMQLAYYMGFSEIYLIGFDHNYVIPESARVEGINITSQDSDPNHFHPDYFGKGYRWHDPCVERMENAYRKAKLFFEKNNVKIFNATIGGHLEVFPRVDFDKLLNKQLIGLTGSAKQLDEFNSGRARSR